MRADERRARAIVRERSGGNCETQIKGQCLGRATNYQHRKNKSQCSKAELWLSSNGLHVCGTGTTGCHGYIHANPAKSYSYGWSCRQALDPRQMPVERRGVWVHLDDDGGVEPVSDVGLVELSQLLGYGVEGVA